MTTMRTVFKCTHVTKDAVEDSHIKGTIPGTECHLLSETVHIEADSLAKLLEKIGQAYAITIDDVFVPDPVEITCLGYNRLEDANGGEPSQYDLAEWTKGRKRLFLANYEFTVAKQQVFDLPVILVDLDAEKIQYHR